MYQSFELRNFRCFSRLPLTDLNRVNLIAGMNNIGKTTLLEALFIHAGAFNPELTIRINAFRGFEKVKVELNTWAEMPWNSLFHQFDVSKIIEIIGKDTTTGERSLKLRQITKAEDRLRLEKHISSISAASQPSLEYEKPLRALENSVPPKAIELEYREKGNCKSYFLYVDQGGLHTVPPPPAPPFPAFFLGTRTSISFEEQAERFGKLEIEGIDEVVLGALQVIEPRLRRLTVVVVNGQPVLHADVGEGRLMPLPLMGEGMVKLANLITNIGNAPKGVLLIDEIENGLHHSILPKVWRAIGEAARQFNAQVFATTHSLECIVAAHRAFVESKTYDFRLHRLERVKGEIKALTYEQEALNAAIETGLEVR